MREKAFAVLALAACFMIFAMTTNMWWLHWFLTPLITAISYPLIQEHSLGTGTIA